MSTMVRRKAVGNDEVIANKDLDFLVNASHDREFLEVLQESHPLGLGITHEEVREAHSMILEFKQVLESTDAPEFYLDGEQYGKFEEAQAWNKQTSMRELLGSCPERFKNLIPPVILEKITPPPVRVMRHVNSSEYKSGSHSMGQTPDV
jgi:hypothetical protein